MRTARSLALAILFTPFAGVAPAVAQEPIAAGPSMQTLLDLASALGEAHAIRTLCNGEGDQTWRVYMQNLMDLEAPGGSRKSQMTGAFNRGYRSQSSRRSECTPELREVEAEIASRGRALADLAARSYLQ